MFYTIVLMLFFACILLIFDHESRYSWLFVLMSVGAVIAFFFFILYINTFASYGIYTRENPYYWMDWKIFQTVTNKITIPIVYKIRMINVGIFLYLLAATFFNYTFSMELTGKTGSSKNGGKRRYSWTLSLLFLIPAVSLVLPDPYVSTKMYLSYHLSSRPDWNYLIYSVLEVGYKLLVLFLLFRPSVLLLRLVLTAKIPFLKRRLILFSIGLILANSVFYLFFYIGTCSISVEKVIRSGFWIFENMEGNIPEVYKWGSPIIFVVIGFCMFMLLSFRLDISATPFTERKIRKNISIMNEILGETLHSQKNLYFSMQLLIRRIERQGITPERVPEIGRLAAMVDNSLDRVTEMLDKLKETQYTYFHNNILDIIDEAIQEVQIPGSITLEWDRRRFEEENTLGMYDRNHMTKALVNVINNAEEAIELSERPDGKIRIEIDFLLRWMVIVIQDNGTGIRRREQKHIFSPHYSGKRGKMNWGLGLPYVYKVVKAHLGQIRIDSKYGSYTSVLLMLPVTKEKRGRKSREGKWLKLRFLL